jgi:pyruvate dehydrogenase E2 component (dihydrolipoamide acetyltransferase)
MSQFLLPDLGEGLEEAQLVQWLVQVGETVQLNQPICQVETAKALVDIPSPYAGTVQALHAQPGDTVPVGAPLITIEEKGVGASHASPASTTEAGNGHEPVLVGYGNEGPAQSFVRRSRRGVAPPVAASAPAASAPAAAPQAIPAPAADELGRATPLVRKIATERGIDLSAIKGTGPGGRIRVEDLEQAPGRAAAILPQATEPAADEERISTVGLRKAIAAKMVKSATTIPHFTEYGLFDASAVTALRERLKADPAYAGRRITFLPFFVAALVAAVHEYPIMNSRWDEDGNAIVVKHSTHVGIATDTPRGLLVPVVHNAHALSFLEIAALSEDLVERARAGTLDAKSMTGGTLTITNVGASGPVDTGTPLINAPEACVVGFGAIKPRPTVVGDTIEVRPGAWISISCDHRIVDGATAARFFGAIVKRLEEPESLVR